MDSQAIAVFVEAVSGGSLAAAARRLRLEPLAASRSLAGLEKEFGVRLLHRTTRSLSLTAEGHAFLPHAQAVLEAEAAARASVQSGEDELEGLLRVTTSAVFARKVLAPFIADFMARHSALQVDLLMTDRVVDLVSEGVDLAIRLALLPDSTMIARRLADNPRALFAAPAYLARHGTPRRVADLVEHACICVTGRTHWRFVRDGQTISQRVAGRFTANSIEGLHQACVGGLGITLVSLWEAAEDERAGRLVRVELEDAEQEMWEISAVYPSRRHLPAKLRRFVDALQRHLAVALDDGRRPAPPVLFQ